MTSPSVIERLRGEVGEVLARHSKTRSLADFAKYHDDPAAFFREVLHCDMWHRQLEMADAVRDHGRTVVVTSNGIGKDFATARIALWWIFARRGFVVLTGPTERQVKQIVMREVRRAFSRAPELPGDLYALELRVNDDCGLIAFTSDDPDRLTGFHHPRLLVCMTEAQGVNDDAYEAAQACVTGPENRLFIYGNPISPTGAFYRAAQSDSWHRITISAEEHPNVISGREEIPGAVSRGWIETMLAEYGTTSSIYKSRVMAQFPEDAIEGLVQRRWLRAAFEKHASGVLDIESASHPLVLSVDVARYGGDATVVAWVRGAKVERLVRWHGASITDTAGRVQALAHEATPRDVSPKFPGLSLPPTIICDEPGLGGGLIDVLRERKLKVVAFNGAAKPIDETRFLNCRAESFWKFRELLEQGRAALPEDSMLEEEALAIQWGLAQNGGKIQILSKDLIRKELGRSPDALDACVMGLAYSVGGLRREASMFTFRTSWGARSA